ncbi:hypothetical protein MHLP_01745 [Candidatus Mycoplasma haematolamae str. Purdue]|uniref:Uncharacterized protein n=1 Tax=Mycoplasma haematolamae (strain Purdue) TaxID=1212765 RepID=I7CJ90_MYCHA|nr:hypothetical protein [Candidatus Mycoplasma haematolamae]AFO51929.1 hypothetical protein MHLP_01745 [Candidatus Mycoplasma haematolamae str. Purdue]
MHKAYIIFSGLGAGTAVSGGTHLIQNVRPSIDKKTQDQQNRGVQENLRQPEAQVIDSPVDAPRESQSQKALDPGLKDQETVTPDVEAAGSEQDQVLKDAVEPRVQAGSRKDDSGRQIQDILGSPTQIPAKSTERYKRGTESRPDIVCVSEETDEVTYDWRRQKLSKRRLACIKTSNDKDYDRARRSLQCTIDITGNLEEDSADRLLFPTKQLCRYWDS